MVEREIFIQAHSSYQKMNQQLMKVSQVIDILVDLNEIVKNLKTRKTRRWWTKPHLHNNIRDKFSAYRNLFIYFSIKDHEEFYKFCRMSLRNFMKLHELVHLKLIKLSNRMPLSTSERLIIVLHYFAHGGSIRTEALLFHIGLSTLYDLIVEVSTILSEVLISKYVQMPNKTKWLQIAESFNAKWNFPNCIGALDGTHIKIQKPSRTGALYKNYKKFFSIILLALCDAEKKFIWFNVGDYGSNSDSSTFAATDLSEKLKNKTADVPPPRALPNCSVKTPFVIVADEIFGLTENVMKPYSRRNDLTVEEKIFNYRLSRARLTIECTFGILLEKWQILQQPLKFKVNTCNKIVSALIGLHNFILMQNGGLAVEINQNYNSTEQQNISPTVIRERLKNYFSSADGAVDWQYNYI